MISIKSMDKKYKLEKYENWPYCGKIGEHYLNW